VEVNDMMTLKEQIAEAIEARFEYACDKDGGKFSSDDMAEVVMQVVMPLESKLVILSNASSEFMKWFNGYPDLRMGMSDLAEDHPYRFFWGAVNEANDFLSEVSEVAK
jgi:hypothetical protein